jgi:hypothetical protein
MATDKTNTAQTRRARGRPRKSPLGQPRRQIKFRAPAALADWLAEDARAAGRSVSDEIESRLLLSFAPELWKQKVLAEIDAEMIGLIGKGLMDMANAGQIRFDDSDPARGPQYVFSSTTLPPLKETLKKIAAERRRFISGESE